MKIPAGYHSLDCPAQGRSPCNLPSVYVASQCGMPSRASPTQSASRNWFTILMRGCAEHILFLCMLCLCDPSALAQSRTRLEHYFQEFAHATSHGSLDLKNARWLSQLTQHCQGYMTVYEFTRFCRAYGLFKLRPGRRGVPAASCCFLG